MKLENYISKFERVAIAFSGGVDSAYLLYSAMKSKAEVRAYYVRTAFQPEFEYKDAVKLANELGAKLTVIREDILCKGQIVNNPADRCYHCKKVIMKTIISHATEDGYTVLMDGTNASDQVADRPGMQALKELSVVSPLRECGLTKDMIRELSRSAGLFTWDKPAYACLATRIPTGEKITADKLAAVESGEEYLMSLGFRDFRIRSSEGIAKLQLREGDFLLATKHRHEIVTELKKYYKTIVLDMEVRG